MKLPKTGGAGRALSLAIDIGGNHFFFVGEKRKGNRRRDPGTGRTGSPKAGRHRGRCRELTAATTTRGRADGPR